MKEYLVAVEKANLTKQERERFLALNGTNIGGVSFEDTLRLHVFGSDDNNDPNVKFIIGNKELTDFLNNNNIESDDYCFINVESNIE